MGSLNLVFGTAILKLSYWSNLIGKRHLEVWIHHIEIKMASFGTTEVM